MKVLPFVDVIAMDMKLPSATGCSHWPTHKAFLERICRDGGKIVFVKIVVDERTRLHEIEAAADLVASVDRGICLVLQPDGTVFFSPGSRKSERDRLLELLMSCQKLALGYLQDVRVIPQCHRILDVR
jgi:organic radical activating enzyme